MKSSIFCNKCDSVVVYNAKATNQLAALLSHYKSSHCRKRKFIDNSIKSEQTIRFVQHLSNNQYNDDNDYDENEPIYGDPSIQHALAFNDSNVINHFDQETIEIEASGGHESKSGTVSFEGTDMYYLFQNSIRLVVEPSLQNPWPVGWIRNQHDKEGSTTKYNWKDAADLGAHLLHNPSQKHSNCLIIR